MISFLGKLKAKKGFTIIELVVVIAIIGVLMAMIVPALFYDNRPARGKVLAKNFFYTVQDTMTSLKTSSPGAMANVQADFGEDQSIIIFYADIDNFGNISASGALVGRVKRAFGSAEISSLSAANADRAKMMSKVQDAIEAYTASMDGMKGTLFVAVDDQFRAQMAYWTNITNEGNILKNTNISSNDDTFTLAGDDYYFVAYPTNYSLAGTKVFAI